MRSLHRSGGFSVALPCCPRDVACYVGPCSQALLVGRAALLPTRRSMLSWPLQSGIDKGFLGSGFWWHFWPSYELVLSSFLPSNILDFWIFLPIWFLHQWLLKRVLAFFCIQSGLIWSLCSQKICYFYSLLGYCTQSIKHCYWLAPVGPVSTSALWVYLDVFLLKMLLIILGFITDFWQFSVSLTTFPLFLAIFLWFHEFLALLLAYFWHI